MQQRREPQERSWEELAEHYNRQTRPEVIAEMNKFWGFKADD